MQSHMTSAAVGPPVSHFTYTGCITVHNVLGRWYCKAPPECRALVGELGRLLSMMCVSGHDHGSCSWSPVRRFSEPC